MIEDFISNGEEIKDIILEEIFIDDHEYNCDIYKCGNMTIKKIILECKLFNIISYYQIILHDISYCIIIKINNRGECNYYSDNFSGHNMPTLYIQNDALNYYNSIFNGANKYNFMYSLLNGKISNEKLIFNKPQKCSNEDNIKLISIVNEEQDFIVKFNKINEYITNNNLIEPFPFDVYLFVIKENNSDYVIKNKQLLNFKYNNCLYKLLFNSGELLNVASRTNNYELFIWLFENNYNCRKIIFYSLDIMQWYNNVKQFTDNELLYNLNKHCFECNLDIIKWILLQSFNFSIDYSKLILLNEKQPIKNEKYTETNNYLKRLL